MITQIRLAMDNAVFGARVFEHLLGNRIPLNVDGSDSTETGTLVAAEVVEEGHAVLLTVEVP